MPFEWIYSKGICGNKGNKMIKLILLLLIVQYVIVYLKYKSDKYTIPQDFKDDLIPGYFWVNLIKSVFN